MEARKITIVSTRTQKKYVLDSTAETLGQLKQEMDAKNIDYNDLVFHEGITKTELTHNDSLLPKNVSYKGNITNELVFMLIAPKKKIESGISYAELLKYIKDNNLAADVKSIFNADYHCVPKAKLESFVGSHKAENAETEIGVIPDAPCHGDDCKNCEYKTKACDAKEYVEDQEGDCDFVEDTCDDEVCPSEYYIESTKDPEVIIVNKEELISAVQSLLEALKLDNVFIKDARTEDRVYDDSTISELFKHIR